MVVTFAHPFDDDRSNGDVRHEVAVHDIDVQPIGARGFDSLNLVFETAEVRGQNGRGDFHRLHLRSLSHARGKKPVSVMKMRQCLKILPRVFAVFHREDRADLPTQT
jgi:hypothetical protein